MIASTIVFVLYTLSADTRRFTWGPDSAFNTLKQCRDWAADPEHITDAHDIVDKWKCVKYKIAK